MSGEQIYGGGIILISILLPTFIGILFFGPSSLLSVGVDVSFLPKMNAGLNSATTFFLLLGYLMIRKGRINKHRYCMIVAFLLSVLFLVSYVIYHASTEPTHYGGTGTLRYLYYFILGTHIVMAVVIVPMVLITLYRGLTNQFNKHKRIARWTLPCWIYVTVTGVLVYLFLMPYY